MSNEKVAVKQITILWSEGLEEENLVFTSFTKVNDLLETIAENEKEWCANGAYVKTRFEIEWADGYKYDGRLDVTPTEDKNITEHILAFINYNKAQNPNESAEYDSFLATYALTDEENTNNKANNQMLNTVKYLLSKYSASEVLNILVNTNIDSLEAHNLIMQAI